jgi:hypothetical protein
MANSLSYLSSQVTINKAKNGFIVQVGCETYVFKTFKDVSKFLDQVLK